jgi:acyl carrier protein
VDRLKITKEVIGLAYDVAEVEVLEDDNLKEYGMDSIALVSLIVEIEMKYNITFSDDDLNPDNLITINNIVDMMEKYL